LLEFREPPFEYPAPWEEEGPHFDQPSWADGSDAPPPDKPSIKNIPDAIVNVLRRIAHPVTSKEIMDELEAYVVTETGNPRKAISSTLSMMVKKGRLEFYKGQFRLPHHSDEEDVPY
jgi:hypothetical protein